MHGRACKQYIFRSSNTSTLNAMPFVGDPFTCHCEKEEEEKEKRKKKKKKKKKKAEGFQISYFYGSFSNDHGSDGVNVIGCRVDILRTNCDQCVSVVPFCCTSTETIRLIRTGSPGRPPRLSHTAPELCGNVLGRRL